jgi:hypothetical protein
MEHLSSDNILGALGLLVLLVWIALDMPAGVERRRGGTTTLHYAAWVRWYFLFAAFAIPVGITLLAIVHKPKDDDEMIALYFVYALFAVISLPMWWLTTRFSLEISAKGLRCRSPWRGTRFVAWDEIVKLSRSEIWRCYFVEARGGYRFGVPDQMFPGVDYFLAALARHRPEIRERI